jgi:hypothetical protein
MIEGRGEYGRSIGAGACRNARPCVARGLCDSEAMPTGSTGEHGATRGEGETSGALFAPESETTPPVARMSNQVIYVPPRPRPERLLNWGRSFAPYRAVHWIGIGRL